MWHDVIKLFYLAKTLFPFKDLDQGDQIGRKFDSWVIAYFGRFLLKEESQIIWLFFPQCKICIKFDKTWVGLHFGRLFINSSGHPDLDCAWLAASLNVAGEI
jgi:hypothetical protein